MKPNLPYSTKVGVLLTNLGTPEAPTPKAVRAYLKEFLWDPYVVEIPKPIWWLILHGFILPFRPKKSARLYQKIWTPEGSPLLVFSQKLMHKLQLRMQENGTTLEFALGMRYGRPSIQEALATLRAKNIERLITLPLYPQYSSTTTASMKNQICTQLQQLRWHPKHDFIEHYFNAPSYIDAIAHTLQEHWRKQTPGQKLLFSFHGIPEKYIARGDPYFEQCQKTAHQVACLLQIPSHKWEVVFQSRFGREKWLQPYAQERLISLPGEGYKHIDVICPGFPVDCLETVEEMAITNRSLFLNAGGASYNYIPALNDLDVHIACLAEILLF